jgi:hypothetical protein
MSDTYEPDSRFMEKLEWQLTSEFRRRNRMKIPGKIAVSRGAFTLAVVAGVLLTGIAMTKATDLIKESWRKKIEVAKAEMDVRLSTALAVFNKERSAKAQAEVSNGSMRQEDYQVIKLFADISALNLEKSQLNLKEVEASGEAPRNEIYAPVVGGRDFVGERLGIEKRLCEVSIELSRARIEQRSKQVEDKDMARRFPFQRNENQTVITSEEASLESVERRIDLREKFISGQLSARDAEIQDRIAVAERDLRQAQAEVDFMMKQLAQNQAIKSKETNQEKQVQALQFGIQAAREQVALASLVIETLKKVK